MIQPCPAAGRACQLHSALCSTEALVGMSKNKKRPLGKLHQDRCSLCRNTEDPWAQ